MPHICTPDGTSTRLDVGHEDTWPTVQQPEPDRAAPRRLYVATHDVAYCLTWRRDRSPSNTNSYSTCTQKRMPPF